MGGRSGYRRNRAVACVIAAAVALAAWPATGSAVEPEEIVTELAWSVRLGGTNDEYAYDVAVAADGTTFISGVAVGDWLTTPSPGSTAGASLFAKMSVDGELLVAKRLPKGAGPGLGIALDPAGGAYVVGRGLDSIELTTPDAFQTTFAGGNYDAFVARLDDNGTIEWATYLGGGDDDVASDVAVDDEGSAYVVGNTRSVDFPVRGAAQPEIGGFYDGFVAKFSRSGELVYSTYVGGPDYDPASSVALDGRDAIVAGRAPTSFPHTKSFGPIGGSLDAYVVRLDASGAFRERVLIGGQQWETADGGVVLAPNGDVVLVGRTFSTDFPMVGPSQSAPGGAGDVFVARLDLDEPALLGSTYFGLAAQDTPRGVDVDTAGRIWVAGETSDLRPINAIMPYAPGKMDAFVVAFNDSLAPVFATSYGGERDETVGSIAAYPDGGVIVAGGTNSLTFPTFGGHTSVSSTGKDLFAARLRLGCPGDALPETTVAVETHLHSTGWYRTGVQVTLGVSPWCSYEGTFASTDGGPLVEGNKLYIGGDGYRELAAHAVAHDGRNGPTVLHVFPIDATRPLVAFDSTCADDAQPRWCRYPFNVTASVDDATSGLAAAACRLDGVDVACGSPLSLEDGSYTLSVDASDVAGNRLIADYPMGVDTQPPAITIHVPPLPPGGAFTAPLPVRVSATDAMSGVASIEPELDGISVGRFFTIGGDGVHHVLARATDRVGNEGVAETYVAIDLLPPVTTPRLSGLEAAPGIWRSWVDLVFDVADTTPTATHVSINGGPWTTADALTIDREGVYTIEYYSTDSVGREEVRRFLRLTVDVTPPHTIARAPIPGSTGWLTAPAVVEFAAADAVTGIAGTRVRVNNGTVPAGPVLLRDGEHDVRYFSVDRAGNVEPPQQTTVRIDATPPDTVAELSGDAGHGEWWRSDVEVSLRASDATSGVASTWLSVDGAPPQVGTTARIVGEGTHVIRFGSTDVAGNVEAERSVTIRIDRGAPVIAFATPQPGGAYLNGERVPIGMPTASVGVRGPEAIVIGALVLEAPATDAASGVARVEYFLDGALIGAAVASPWSIAWDAGDASPGTHVLLARAVDRAGNVASATVKVATVPGA